MSYALIRLSQMLLFLKRIVSRRPDATFPQIVSVVSRKPDAMFPQKVSSRLSQMLFPEKSRVSRKPDAMFLKKCRFA